MAWGAAIAALAMAPARATGGSGNSDDGRWFADTGKGTYLNPVLIGDYSDPDVVRVDEVFYLVSSSFTASPGLPILQSRDLVNWTIAGHALPRLSPDDHFRTPRRGGGVWAPTIRHRNGKFLIYYCDPDQGIFRVTATDPAGPWSAPELVDATTGVIDPAPFWDEDGAGWLAYAYARSRAGKSNIIGLKRLNAEGNRTEGEEKIIVDGNALPPVATSIGPRPWQTTEGPKLYKRNGWYYVFAPSGSVKGGWQGVFRSRSITGPYEGRNVLDQGRTATNGPHQGAWVTTVSGQDWFLHFQDRDSFGRVVHLQPMRWKGDWPVIGSDRDGDGRGEPVPGGRKPSGTAEGRAAPAADDEFASGMSLAWQFGSNPGKDWALVRDGWLRLKSVTGSPDLYEVGAILSQKLPATSFTATTTLRFEPLREGERAGLAVHGKTFGWIGVEKRPEGFRIVQAVKDAEAPGQPVKVVEGLLAKQNRLWFRLSARPVTLDVPPPDFSPYWPSMLRETHMRVEFSYSLDGSRFQQLGNPFITRPGRWVGAQLGLFAQAASGTSAAMATTVGYTEFDWFRIGK